MTHWSHGPVPVLFSFRNALSQAMMEQLVFALEGDEKKNKDLSSVVISGRGRVFSAGHDLTELVSCMCLVFLSLIYYVGQLF